MEFLNKIQINKHEIIKKRGLEFAKVLNGEDKNIVLSIIQKSEEYLKTIGDKNNVVYSPTTLEMAAFKRAVKRYVQTDYRDVAMSRIKPIPLDVDDIDGICNECRKYQYYDDFCEGCEKKVDYRYQIHCRQVERSNLIYSEFNRAVEITVFSDDLIGNWLLLSRRKREDKESKHIDNALSEFIRDELMNEFTNQNKQLLKKYQLWQNQ